MRTYILGNSCSKLTAFKQISHLCFLVLCVSASPVRFQWRIQGRGLGGQPPLIFRLKWGPKGQKNFFGVRPPPPPPLPLTASATWFDRLPSGQSERGVIKILEGIFFQLYFTHADFSGSWSKKMIKGFEISLACITRVIFFYVSQESEGNLSARHAMTGVIEVRQAVKGNYSVYRVSSLCFSAVNSLGGPLWKLNDTIFVAILKNLNKFN